MKCIINAGGILKRVSNKKALELVDGELWEYCSKREWKESRKKVKK